MTRRRASNQAKPTELVTVTVDKLVHGGQGLGTLPDGRKVFVWNALPGETVIASISNSKKSYAEGVATTIITPSPERIEPKELHYLATSPWQILSLEYENGYKAQIVQELFAREKVELPLGPNTEVVSAEPEWRYRNKMEYCFFGDADGVHLALYARGSHTKIVMDGSVLAMPAIDAAARAFVEQLNALDMRAGDLKTIVIRANQSSSVVAALYVNKQDLPRLQLPSSCAGLVVYYSDPRSPASVPTKKLYTLGSCDLADAVLGTNLRYDVDSFFQVNLPIFELAVRDIQVAVKAFMSASKTEFSITDMYSGVGSIGLSLALELGVSRTVLVEIDKTSVAMAKRNAAELMMEPSSPRHPPRPQNSVLHVEVVHASGESALQHITPDTILIVDPPRAGLHTKLIDRILEARPPLIVYLSCNPATQARDCARLQSSYDILSMQGYNFFPHTPHIETLVILRLKH